MSRPASLPDPREHAVADWFRMLVLAPVRFYRYAISPLMAPRCRFFPSCSEYAIEAVERHGAWRGGWLAARRVCRCHPWNPGGIDEVPKTLPSVDQGRATARADGR